MAEKIGVSVVDGDDINPNVSDRDAEKTQARSGATEGYADQIPDDLLKVIAPNGESEYILDKINNMTEEEAVAIITESHKFHADDWNFPSGGLIPLRPLRDADLASHQICAHAWSGCSRVRSNMANSTTETYESMPS
jgi:hypothetical protein